MGSETRRAHQDDRSLALHLLLENLGEEDARLLRLFLLEPKHQRPASHEGSRDLLYTA